MAIEFSNVQYSWQQSQRPLLNIERFAVKAGEKVFIAGPSGSGKTTLLGLMGGVLLPDRGAVRILGCEINKLKGGQRDAFRADHIGFIFQMFNLLPYLNVTENVLLALRYSPRRRANIARLGHSPEDEAKRLLQDLGLHDTGLYGRSVSQLSVGQQQRVAVARALIGSPEILVADEPTSALDSEARESFLKLVFEECKRLGTTLVYVSHDRGMLELFDRAVGIDSFKK